MGGLDPPPERRAAARDERARPLVAELEAWLRQNRRALSTKSATANAIDYLLKRWPSFTRFLDDGRICLSNNAAAATGPSPDPIPAAAGQRPSTR
ncbi:IS66 family transposase [Thalassobaculum litoreum]|uniref:Transposase IS66 family protein n=1 Tax=Thalassobaculum litoreum DSM 18839 TaxID=1123362 RepID=A0A8G2BMY4_9PROT|nr:Transposase IS66 family protein [Thalassobaculum litoreum DSM 18839]